MSGPEMPSKSESTYPETIMVPRPEKPPSMKAIAAYLAAEMHLSPDQIERLIHNFSRHEEVVQHYDRPWELIDHIAGHRAMLDGRYHTCDVLDQIRWYDEESALWVVPSSK